MLLDPHTEGRLVAALAGILLGGYIGFLIGLITDPKDL